MATAEEGLAIGAELGHLDDRSRALRPRNVDSKVSTGICPFCSVGCATLVYRRGNTVIDVEGDPASPINAGTLCAKGAALLALHADPARWTTCKYRAPGATEWQEVSLDWATERIARRVTQTRDATFQEHDDRGRTLNRTMAIAALGGPVLDNEESYLMVKLFRSLGMPLVESHARACHSATMAGLGASFGQGASTTFLMDLQHADLIVIQGSNFAESHPVGFRFVTMAKSRGAFIVHVDPRFTRTSALADLHVPIRAGTDIALLGGLINYVLQHERYFREYVLAYTNASFLVDERYRDSEDLDGLFGGFDAESSHYAPYAWPYEFEPAPEHEPPRPLRDLTLQHPRCVLNLIRRHYARYTPEMVERICGTPPETFRRLAESLCDNSGRERTAALCYGTGFTQHTTGTQNVRAGALLQSLLGNLGRPGGGIMALSGSGASQGSSDTGMLYDLLPGYLPVPTLERDEVDFATWARNQTARGGGWSDFPKYAVSLLKAWYGEAAHAHNGWAFDHLPKNTGDHSLMPIFVAMKDGTVRGLFLFGENPAVGGQNAEFQRNALAKLDWLVVRDVYETESAAFWRREGVDPKQIPTEVFFLPNAVGAEKAGTLTNAMRLLQFHEKAVDPPGESRSDLSFVYALGKRLKELYAGSALPRDLPLLELTWGYEHAGERERLCDEPDVEAVMREMNGFDARSGAQLADGRACRDDGTTACGCWVYGGMYPSPAGNLTRRRTGDAWVSLGWGWSWPANHRQLYDHASADPAGNPWSERKRYAWRDQAQDSWSGYELPGTPFAMSPDGVAQLFAPTGALDAPLPTHYEPAESPVANALYPRAQVNPTLKQWRRRDNPYHAAGDPRYPYVVTTFATGEHHADGSLTRRMPWLAELQPELFCELSPELAAERGIRNGEWVTLETMRGEVEAKALVTARIAPLRLGPGRIVHQIAIPWHWGWLGLVTGDTPNDLTALVADPNASIHEGKAFTCNLRPGRRSVARPYAADDDIPLGQRNPLGTPSRPGPVTAAAGAQSSQPLVVSPETVMAAAKLLRQPCGELP